MIRRRRPDDFGDIEAAPLDAEAWVQTWQQTSHRTGLALTEEYARRGRLLPGRAITTTRPSVSPTVRVARAAHARPRPVSVLTRVRRLLPGGPSRPALPAGAKEDR